MSAPRQHLTEALKARLQPDVSFQPAAVEIGFVHRSADSAEIYFLANTGNVRRQVQATFRVEGMQAELWDPLTGSVGAARAIGPSVPLDFEPYGSIVVVFSKRKLPVAASNRTVRSIDLSTGWKVNFGPRTIHMETLQSWTDDEETRYYSGIALYQKTILVPETLFARGMQWRLDLGESRPIEPTAAGQGMQAWLEAPVREAALVYVNGNRAGSVWCPPYSVDITGLLKPGANTIRIETGNLAINHMAGRPLPDYRLLHQRYGVRFAPQDLDRIKPVAAGLLGPIRLVAWQ